MKKINFKSMILYIITIFLFLYTVPTLSLYLIKVKFPMKNSEMDTVQTDDLSISDEDLIRRMVQVYDVNKKIVIEIEIEEYIMGVVAGEMPAEFQTEALKAQAVAARTYLLYKLKKNTGNPEQHKDAPICSGTHCQVYYSKDMLLEKFSQDWFDKYWEKIANAVESTRGEILSYDKKVIEPLFHSTSGGKTENSEEVFGTFMPYLRSVESPYEEASPKLSASVTIPIADFIKKLNDEYGVNDLTTKNLKTKISLVEMSEGGKIKELKISDKTLTGREIRTLYNLNSANFKFIQSKDAIQIVTTGYGHGVGMSQYGANGMAAKGHSYEEILKHYYTGVEILKTK
jgi:stage II sporulation protein D